MDNKRKIKLHNNNEELTPTEDIISIMNIYTAKINELIKYKKHIVDEINIAV